MRRLLYFLRDEEAATAVEYAVLLALILMSVIGAIGTVGAQSGGMWGNIEGQLNGTPFGH
jgi:pilus assembly protein Flp/PilA